MPRASIAHIANTVAPPVIWTPVRGGQGGERVGGGDLAGRVEAQEVAIGRFH